MEAPLFGWQVGHPRVTAAVPVPESSVLRDGDAGPAMRGDPGDARRPRPGTGGGKR